MPQERFELMVQKSAPFNRNTLSNPPKVQPTVGAHGRAPPAKPTAMTYLPNLYAPLRVVHILPVPPGMGTGAKLCAPYGWFIILFALSNLEWVLDAVLRSPPGRSRTLLRRLAGRLKPAHNALLSTGQNGIKDGNGVKTQEG